MPPTTHNIIIYINAKCSRTAGCTFRNIKQSHSPHALHKHTQIRIQAIWIIAQAQFFTFVWIRVLGRICCFRYIHIVRRLDECEHCRAQEVVGGRRRRWNGDALPNHYSKRCTRLLRKLMLLQCTKLCELYRNHISIMRKLFTISGWFLLLLLYWLLYSVKLFRSINSINSKTVSNETYKLYDIMYVFGCANYL